MTLDTRLAASNAGLLFLIQMDFTSGTQRLTNWTHNVDWMGYTWAGLGAVVSVGGVAVAERLEYPAVEIGLNPGNPSLLALALGNVSTYRRRPVTIWYATLDEELRADGDPEPWWAGLMDQVRLSTGNGEDDGGSVVMRCENPCRDSRAPKLLRLNHAQHQARWPGDTGLSRIERLTGQPQVWLSKKFQRQ